MKPARAMLATLLLLPSLTIPARADFQYTETTQVTGGTLVKVMKSLSFFAKKQTQDALKPTISTRSVKGSRLRMDETDGTSEIIDLDGRRMIAIDNNKKTYSIITFDQMQAAMQQVTQNLQQAQAPAPQPDATPQNVKLDVTPTFKVIPGSGNRVILDQATNETKLEMDLAMQATATGDAAPPPGQPNSATVNYTMNVDEFVAPNVAGYMQFAEFYRQMAMEANWIKLPTNIHVADPRVTQGLSTLQQNSDALKGFPLLSYTNMTMVIPVQPDGSQPSAQSGQSSGSNASQSSSSNSSSNSRTSNTSSNTIDNPTAALTKGLGSLFNKKKQDKDKDKNQNADPSQPAPPPNAEASDNDLIEITTQVTKFSDSSLDGSLFDIPSGYAQVQADPGMGLAGPPTQPKQPGK